LRRRIVAAFVPAAVCAGMWARIEQPHDSPLRIVAVVLVALAPGFVRPRALAVPLSLVLGARLVFDFWLHPLRLLSHFKRGFLAFYDVPTPFDPRTHTEMRSVVLAAGFAFAFAIGVAAARGRTVAVVGILLLGAGWPATLAGDGHALAHGAAVLVALLVVLGCLSGRRPPRAFVPVAALLLFVALAAGSSSAIAKGELVHWQGWDFYTAADKPVGVRFVWNAQYAGLHFPAKRTTVLRIKAGPNALYWRAALLDDFKDDRWVQGKPRAGDGLEPAAEHLVRQDVTVEALRDTRLVGGGVPIRFVAGAAPIVHPQAGTALLPEGLSRGFQYTVFSYAPNPTAAQLARSQPRYPRSLASFREVSPGVLAPPFGAPGRNTLLDAHPEIERYVPLAQAAETVAGRARTPYAAAASLESWFRTRGGFTYSNHPFVFAGAPLVGFVAQARAGYCQYFAGAMALMLRYLGVPARVAVGFASGTYDAHRREWTVTDHDAHAWVEAWFRGYGWLPFDPTPAAGRPEQGALSAPYAVAAGHSSGGTFPPAKAGGSKPAQAASRHRESSAAPAPSSAPARHATSPGHVSLLLVLLGLLGVVIAAIVLAKLVVRRGRFLTRDPRRVAAACRRELADFLLDQRIEAARSATLHELGALVRDELAVDPQRFVAAATAARFGPPAGAAGAARAARRELRVLVSSVRARLTARERVRGLFSLRSLGFAP
jgi:transglutaminase-like putative cysteine protease